MKNKKLALALLFYPFGVFGIIGLMLSRRKKIVFVTFALTAYLFAMTFIPLSSTNFEIKAEKWKYGYSGGLGINRTYSESENISDNDVSSETTSTVTSLSADNRYTESLHRVDYTDEVNSRTTTKPTTARATSTKTKTPKVKTSSRTTTSKATSTTTTTASKPIIYLNDESKVYSDWNLMTVHTDKECQKLKGTVLVMSFEEAIKEQIPYCSKCADTVIYVTNDNDE